MSLKRKLAVAAALSGVVLGLAALAATSERLQTWVVRRRIAGVAPTGVTIDRARIGLGSVELQGIRIERDGSVLVMPEAEGRIDVLAAAMGRGLRIRQLTAKGWTLDFSRARGAAAAAAPAPGQASSSSAVARALGGILAAFNVPAALSLAEVDLAGSVVLADAAGRPVGRARVTVTGGGLEPGRAGQFECGAWPRSTTRRRRSGRWT